MAPVEQKSIAVPHSRQCDCSTDRTEIYRFNAQQTVPLKHRYNSNLSLYCTADSATVAPIEQQTIVVLHSRQCHCSTDRTAIYRCTAQQTVPLKHRLNNNLSLYFTADRATVAPIEQKSMGALHSRECHCSTDITTFYRCTAQQTVPL